VATGYLLAAVLLAAAGATELAIGVDAEGRSLESISEPLASGV
jgi:hypothetical protein